MIVYSLRIALSAPWVNTLKEKRSIVKSVIARMKHALNVSVIELEEQDNHRLIVLGIALIAHHNAMADAIVEQVLMFLEENCEAEIVDVQQEVR